MLREGRKQREKSIKRSTSALHIPMTTPSTHSSKVRWGALFDNAATLVYTPTSGTLLVLELCTGLLISHTLSYLACQVTLIIVGDASSRTKGPSIYTVAHSIKRDVWSPSPNLLERSMLEEERMGYFGVRGARRSREDPGVYRHAFGLSQKFTSQQHSIMRSNA